MYVSFSHYQTCWDGHKLRLLWSAGCCENFTYIFYFLFVHLEFMTYPWIKMLEEHLQFEGHLYQIHPSHLANRLVHSAASSSCFALSVKYNRAIPGISGLSAATRIFKYSVQERKTSTSSVIQWNLSSHSSYKGNYCFISLTLTRLWSPYTMRERMHISDR